MTKDEWLRYIIGDHMSIEFIDHLMELNYIDITKKYFELHNISITELDFDDNGIKAVIVYKDNKIIAFAHFDCLDDKLDVGRSLEEKDNTIKELSNKLFQFQSQYHDYKATCTKIIDDQRAENLELRDKLKVKDDKIEELSTKLAEVVMDNKKHDDEVEYWKDSIDLKNNYMDELHEKIEDLESTIEGQKEHIADLENEVKDLKIRENGLSNQLYCGVTVVRSAYYEQLKEELEKHKRSTKENCQLRSEIEKLKERLSPTSDKEATKDPDKMPDYEGFRKIADEAQRKMMEEQKKWDNEKINNINRKLSIPAFKLSDDYKTSMGDIFQ